MSSFALCHFFLASVLPDAARDDLAAGGRLFWPETTYRVPANRVRSVGVCSTPAPSVEVEGGVRALGERTARVDMVGGGR